MTITLSSYQCAAGSIVMNTSDISCFSLIASICWPLDCRDSFSYPRSNCSLLLEHCSLCLSTTGHGVLCTPQNSTSHPKRLRCFGSKSPGAPSKVLQVRYFRSHSLLVYKMKNLSFLVLKIVEILEIRSDADQALYQKIIVQNVKLDKQMDQIRTQLYGSVKVQYCPLCLNLDYSNIS